MIYTVIMLLTQLFAFTFLYFVLGLSLTSCLVGVIAGLVFNIIMLTKE